MHTMRDYENYDYLSITVKKNKLERLKTHYRELGWEDTAMKEDVRYDDITHISLRRPHKIENKDALQLLQVYLETAWNKIGKIENNPRPKTLICGLGLGLLSAALLIAGICLIFLPQMKFLIVWGLILATLGIITAGLCTAFSIVLFRREGKRSAEELEAAKREIAAICVQARALTNKAEEAEDENQ